MPIAYPGNSTTKPARAKSGGGFESAIEVAGGGSGSIAWTGTVAHGETLTITDSESRFGTRSQVKPLFVWKGGPDKAGSTAGRITLDHFRPAAVLDSAFSLGSLQNTIKANLVEQSAVFGGLTEPLSDPTKPLYEYIERFYEKDITLAENQNDVGGFNLKTNRWYGEPGTGGVTNRNNGYVGYQGSEGANSSRVGMEYLDNNINSYYQQGVPPQQWLSEEYFVLNSSSEGVRDGQIRHYRNNVWLNTLAEDYLQTTIDADHPVGLKSIVLDQVSNRTEMASPQYVWVGLFICDDEPNGVYIGNAATRSSCTKMVRQPQTAWSNSEVSVELVESSVTLSGAYLYFRTGVDSWISDNGVQI